jgi:DNA-binding Lrp family transcriptional regulator
MRRQFAGVNELARALQIDKAAVSRRVARLETRGEIETRQGPYRSKLVDVAAFGRVSGIDSERLNALPTMVDCMAARGQLGEGAESEQRLKAAAKFRDLLQSATFDVEAQKCVEKVEVALGYIDRDLVRSVILENRSPSELSKLSGKSATHLLERIRAALDIVASEQAGC